jgi:hypothetical protein
VRWWRRTPPRPDVRRPGVRWAWLLLGGIGAAVAVAAAVPAPDLGAAIFAGATWGGMAALGVAAALAGAWHVRHRTG